MAKELRILEIVDFENDTSNFKQDFKKITKKYGREYIELVKALWDANDNVLTPDEFCKLNGNMPLGFFNNKISK